MKNLLAIFFDFAAHSAANRSTWWGLYEMKKPIKLKQKS